MVSTYQPGKLGRRPPKRAPSLKLGPLLTGVLPPIPTSADRFSRVSKWVLGANDRFGTCGPTGVANMRLLMTTYLTGKPFYATDAQIFDLYRRSGNPLFDPDTGADDNGVDLQTMLEACTKGGFTGVVPPGFASVDPKNFAELRAAIAIFGGVLLGVNLETAQQTQTTWDHKPPYLEWGGHCVLCGRFVDDPTPDPDTLDRTGVITWATEVDMTDLFIKDQLDEAWVVIWPELLQDQTFLAGVDLEALKSAYTSLTHRPFPYIQAPVPPTPAPMPTGCLPGGSLISRLRSKKG